MQNSGLAKEAADASICCHSDQCAAMATHRVSVEEIGVDPPLGKEAFRGSYNRSETERRDGGCNRGKMEVPWEHWQTLRKYLGLRSAIWSALRNAQCTSM